MSTFIRLLNWQVSMCGLVEAITTFTTLNLQCYCNCLVGKTSLITRFMYDSFDNTYQVRNTFLMIVGAPGYYNYSQWFTGDHWN